MSSLFAFMVFFLQAVLSVVSRQRRHIGLLEREHRLGVISGCEQALRGLQEQAKKVAIEINSVLRTTSDLDRQKLPERTLEFIKSQVVGECSLGSAPPLSFRGPHRAPVNRLNLKSKFFIPESLGFSSCKKGDKQRGPCGPKGEWKGKENDPKRTLIPAGVYSVKTNYNHFCFNCFFTLSFIYYLLSFIYYYLSFIYY